MSAQPPPPDTADLSRGPLRARRVGPWASPAPFLAALAALLVLRPQADPDYWWHVRVGDWILENRAVPHTELLSWLSGGGLWTAPSWGSEALFAVMDRSIGTVGSVVLFFIVSLAILAMVAVLARHVRGTLGPGTLAGLAFAVALVANPIWLPRSQLWDVLFALVAIHGMVRYLDRGSIRGLVAMPFVMIAWANLHGAGALVYLLLAFAVIVGEVWNRRTRGGGRSWHPLLLSVLVSVAALSLNPYGPSLYVYGFTTTASGPTADFILEWQSPNFHTLIMRPAQALLAFGLVGALAFVRLRDARIVALVAGFTFMFLQSGRYMEFLVPVAFGLAGPALITGATRIAAPLPTLRLHFHDGHRRFVGIVGGVLGAILLLGRVLTIPALETASIDGYQPVGATTWLAVNQPPGRLFSEYGWGGYLSYRLDVPVGPYGASDAFGDEVLGDIQGVFTGSVDPGPYFHEHDVQTIVVPRASALGNYLAASGSWQARFTDSRAAVFTRVAP